MTPDPLRQHPRFSAPLRPYLSLYDFSRVSRRGDEQGWLIEPRDPINIPRAAVRGLVQAFDAAVGSHVVSSYGTPGSETWSTLTIMVPTDLGPAPLPGGRVPPRGPPIPRVPYLLRFAKCTDPTGGRRLHFGAWIRETELATEAWHRSWQEMFECPILIGGASVGDGFRVFG